MRMTAASISTLHYVMSILSPSEEANQDSEKGNASQNKEELEELYKSILCSETFWQHFKSKYFLVRKAVYGCVATILRTPNRGFHFRFHDLTS